MNTTTMALFVALTLLTTGRSFSQTATMQNSKPSNMGTEFYFTFLPCYEQSGNNRLMLYISSAENGTATIEVPAKSFSTKVSVKAHDIVPVELGPGIGQAFSKMLGGSIPPEKVYPGSAVHISATVPVVVYAVTRFMYTSDSFLARPLESLGNSYVVASMADMTWMYGGYSLPSETAIVAAYDSTQITFTLGGPSVTVSGGGMRPGESKSFFMNAGDVWIIGNDAQSKEGDMSGSVITSSKPVGVVSGNQCANVPTVLRWCDFIAEMESPTESWGKNLQLPKYTARTNGYFMKVFASEPNTKVFYNGSYWKTIQTVGGQEGRGWIYQRVDGSGNNILSLHAEKPISVTVFNTGQEDDGVSTDPFQMNVVPVDQYSNYFLFSTPGSRGGIGFARNFLGVIFELDSVTLGMPDDLEFGTSVNGNISWRKLSAVFGPNFSTKDIYSVRVNGKTYAFKECILPGDNVYGVRCSRPLMCYSYGGSDYDSYGHPAGALSMDLTLPNDHAVPSVQYTTLSGRVDGMVTDKPDDAKIRSNIAKIVLQKNSTNCRLISQKIDGKNSPSVEWSLVGIDSTIIDAHAVVTVSDRAGNDTTFTIDFAFNERSPVITSLTKDSVCVGDSVTLSCSADYSSYLWSTGQTTKSIRVSSPVAATVSYTLSVVNSKGKNLNSLPYQVHFVAAPPKPSIMQNGNVLSASTSGLVAYAWYRNSVAIPGATSQNYIISEDGVYSVKVTSDLGCTTSSDAYTATMSDVIENELSSSIRLSPNPSHSVLTIEFTQHLPSRVEVVSLRGEILGSFTTRELSSHSLQLPVEDLEAGTYTLRLVFADRVVIRRFIKE